MPGLVNCASCGRKLATEAAKSAGGKLVCPPCHEALKKVVEEKRRRAREEAAAKTKDDLSRPGETPRPSKSDPILVAEPSSWKDSALAPSPRSGEGRGEGPVIIPAGAARRDDVEVERMLRSAVSVCWLARLAGALLSAAAALAVVGGVMGGAAAAAAHGTAGWVGLVIAEIVVAASLLAPALLLWFLGGWVRRFSELFARRLGSG